MLISSADVFSHVITQWLESWAAKLRLLCVALDQLVLSGHWGYLFHWSLRARFVRLHSEGRTVIKFQFVSFSQLL